MNPDERTNTAMRQLNPAQRTSSTHLHGSSVRGRNGLAGWRRGTARGSIPLLRAIPLLRTIFRAIISAGWFPFGVVAVVFRLGSRSSSFVLVVIPSGSSITSSGHRGSIRLNFNASYIESQHLYTVKLPGRPSLG